MKCYFRSNFANYYKILSTIAEEVKIVNDSMTKFACGHLRVSRILPRRTNKKERLLVVYGHRDLPNQMLNFNNTCQTFNSIWSQGAQNHNSLLYWKPNFIFSSPFPQHFHILWKIYTEETKRGKFSRAAWEFNVVLNPRQKDILKQKIIQIYHIASIFTQFCTYVRPL